MHTSDLVVFDDPEKLARHAADMVARSLEAAPGPSSSVVLAGGTTPRRLYEELAAPPFRTRIDWERVHFFWGDERCVPPDDRESNFRMARETLLEPLGIPPPRIHRIVAERGPEPAARQYEGEIARALGVDPTGPPPVLDLVLLGLGPDAHTASLFPGGEAVHERERWVVPVRNAPKPPPERVTMTPVILNAAATVLFLVAGADKADALAGVLDGPVDIARRPAQAIRPSRPGAVVHWLADRAAASRLGDSKR